MGVTVASPAQAGCFDDAIDWVEDAVDTVEDTFKDFANTLENIGTWFAGEENVLGYYPSAGENPVHLLAQQCFAIQSPLIGKYFRLYHHGGLVNDGMNFDTTAAS